MRQLFHIISQLEVTGPYLIQCSDLKNIPPSDDLELVLKSLLILSQSYGPKEDPCTKKWLILCNQAFAPDQDHIKTCTKMVLQPLVHLKNLIEASVKMWRKLVKKARRKNSFILLDDSFFFSGS